MKDFLDQHCVTSNGEPVTSQGLEITFDYSFLAPSPPKADAKALPEAETLWYIGQSEQHRHLLKHPAVTSFLCLKWLKIRGYFNRNLRFFFLFVMTLTWYIFARFGGVSSRSPLVMTRNDTWNNSTKGGENSKNIAFCSDLSNRAPDHGFWFVLFTIHLGMQVKEPRNSFNKGWF